MTFESSKNVDSFLCDGFRSEDIKSAKNYAVSLTVGFNVMQQIPTLS